MAQDVVELRTGQFYSAVLTLNSANLTVIKRALMKKKKNSPTFFQHLSVILQFNPLLEKLDLSALKALLTEFNIHVIGVSDWQNNLQKELILTANLAVLGKSSDMSDILPEPRYLPTKVIEQSVTANQVIYAKNSDLIIHGNVDKGAEVAADGNIHIYGKLKGRAMAGVNNTTGSIYAQCFHAEFVSVCNRFLHQDQMPQEFLQRAVRIFPEKEKLVFRILGEY